MTSSQRIIVNTAAQYTRTILNVCLSLYSTRLILEALGQSDFGIYSLIAGIVAMLSFVTNALVVSTQRFLSYYYGAHNVEKVKSIFSNSLWLHLLIGIGLSIILCSISSLVTHSLNIESGRERATTMVYMASVMMLFSTFLTVPFRALFIARENIVYISIIDVIDGIIKLGLAVWLSHITWDKLEAYGWGMTCVQGFNLLAFGIYALLYFPECHIPKWKDIDKHFLHELSGFAGWTIYSTGCIVARNQGLAVVLNIFLGVLVNTAYGIAQQVSGAVSFISASIINAMNPQIMKAEGAGNRQQMWRLVEYESKYSFLLLAIVTIPLVFEMDTILHIWLIEVPKYAVPFCQIILLTALVDQLTIGLTSAIQAIGILRTYTLIFYTIKLLTIFLVIICLKMDVEITTAMWSFVLVEFVDAFVRFPLVKKISNFSVSHFFRNVLLRIFIPLIVMLCICFSITHFFPHNSIRLIYTCCTTLIGGAITIFLTSLNNTERQYLKTFLAK